MGEEWKKVTTEHFKFKEPGDEIKGVLIKKDSLNFGETSVGRYYIDTGKGVYVVLGTMRLDQDMAFVRMNQYIKITYMNDEPLEDGKRARKFEVHVRIS